MRISQGITPNSIILGGDRSPVFYIVGYRNNVTYGENEWAVRFTPAFENALTYVKNEKEKRDNCNLSPEYKIWQCSLGELHELPAEYLTPKEVEIDY